MYGKGVIMPRMGYQPDREELSSIVTHIRELTEELKEAISQEKGLDYVWLQYGWVTDCHSLLNVYADRDQAIKETEELLYATPDISFNKMVKPLRISFSDARCGESLYYIIRKEVIRG